MISVGVDIGTYSIKIAEVESTSKSYVVRRLHEFPLSLDLTKDKKIEIIDTLRTLFQNYDFEKTQFVFSIPQKGVSARLLDFPFRERFKIQKAVASQLEDDLPFSQEDAIFETKIVRFMGKTAQVMAMAVPKERIGEVLGLAQDCGVQPQLISAEALGLSNLFEKWTEPPPEAPAIENEIPGPHAADLVLNIGHMNSELLVYRDGLLVAARIVDWGARNLADALGKRYGLNPIQAMRELQLKGYLLLDKSSGTKEQVAFSQTLEESVGDFVAALRLKMLELQSEFNLQWTRGQMLGGGSQLKNLGAYLTQAFAIPFNRFKQFEANPPLGFEVTPQIEAVTGIAVGLAIEALRRPRNPAVNFLKGEFAHQSKFFENLWERWGYTTQLVAAGFVILLGYAIARDSLSQRLLDESDRVLRIQAEAIANLKGKRAGNDNIRKFIGGVEKDAKNRKQAEKVTHINSALDILNKISASIPPNRLLNVEIKRISVDNEQTEVQGYVTNAGDVSRIEQTLRKISSNGQVAIVPLRLTPVKGKTTFSFRFPVQRNAGG